MGNSINEVVRREIVDHLLLARKPWHGELDLMSFLKRVWNLASMKSEDDRFTNAEGDIWQHMVRNSDWEHSELIFERLDILNCTDQKFLKFLETYVHPLTERDDKKRHKTASAINRKLQSQGFILHVSDRIGDHDVFLAKATKGTVDEEYEVVLSFAGEDRPFVDKVAGFLDTYEVRYFYDLNEEATLWGKDLAEHLDRVYRSAARYCVMFISKHYVERIWPRHERRSALSRALRDRQEYILPARFDDAEVPGIRPTLGYIDLRKKSPKNLAKLIVQKLGRDLD